jgi:hypothetical protein
MSTWLERFVLALLATILGATVLTNPLQLDRVQQGALIVAIIALSVFAARTIENIRGAKTAPAGVVPSQSPPAPADGLGGSGGGGNQIHLPGDIVEAPHIAKLSQPASEFIASFINSEIVAWSNVLIARHNLNWRPLDQV